MSDTKLKLYSDHIFSYISNRVKKETGTALVKSKDYSYFFIKEYDKDVLRIDSKHNNYPISFLVSFEKDVLLDIEKKQKEYFNELNYVADYIIDYVKRDYVHKR